MLIVYSLTQSLFLTNRSQHPLLLAMVVIFILFIPFKAWRCSSPVPASFVWVPHLLAELKIAVPILARSYINGLIRHFLCA